MKVSKCVSPFAKNTNEKIWIFQFSFYRENDFRSANSKIQTVSNEKSIITKEKNQNKRAKTMKYFLKKLKRKNLLKKLMLLIVNLVHVYVQISHIYGVATPPWDDTVRNHVSI